LRKWRKDSSIKSEPPRNAGLERRFDETVDEILEQAWILGEEEQSKSLPELQRRAAEEFDTHFETAQTEGLITTSSGHFELTPDGRARAREIIRRHRLAETLFSQILEMDETQAESDACRFEHILSTEATESVCTLLGHPPSCPHGKPIPRGACCEKFRTEMLPLVTPLTELSPGEAARIVFIAPKSHARLDRLASLGIVPGSRIRLHQKSPTCVIQVGETDVAIDATVAGEIFVKRI
jgi:DtxR family transcriptional regulator, Mn-dependent transcriptional regulator